MYNVPWVPCLTIKENESVEDRIIRFLTVFDGVSLSNKVEWLKQLTGRGVDPKGLNAHTWKTNCATSALGFIAAACTDVSIAKELHPLLGMSSKIGTSITWIYKIGAATKTIRKYKTGMTLPRVCLASYAGGDHVEWILSEPDSNGIADHGGGGRANNAITVGKGDVFASMGRKLTDILDIVPLIESLAPSPNYIMDEVTITGTPDSGKGIS